LKILTLPTAIINGNVIRGGLSGQVIIMAICSGFAQDKKASFLLGPQKAGKFSGSKLTLALNV